MKQITKLLFSLFLLLVLSNSAFAQIKKLLNKAEDAFYRGEYEKSRDIYKEAYQLDKNDYAVNLGLGILLNEYMENYEESLPYLETAFRNMPKTDTTPELILALGKAYHYLGRLDEALPFYIKMLEYKDEDDNSFQDVINKYVDDCNYAKRNEKPVAASKLFVVNAGPVINTEMPEYVPVLTTNNQLMFTSKRKDAEKEKINDDNGRYFESMYVCELSNGRASVPKRYTFADSKLNSNESVVSILPSGNKIIVYKDNKLYEGDITQSYQKPSQIGQISTFDAYKNHAFLSKNEQEIYFTSETGIGFGGNDIYKSVKQADGTWGQTENLGENINTMFDEQSPFLSEDGNTLYFASTGHLGYGGYDIYKSTLVNGKWSVPVNMGKPINSFGDDLFFVISQDESSAYLSSSRRGGYGEMDIYKVNYTEKLSKECVASTSNALPINTTKLEDKKYDLSVTIPETMVDKILSYSLMVNDSVVSTQPTNLSYTFKDWGDYTIKTKLVAWCDTCITLFVACNEKVLEIKEPPPVIVAAIPDQNNSVVDITEVHGNITDETSKQMGFDLSLIYFNFNESGLRADAIVALDRNIEVLKKYPDVLITLNGYTDSRGSAMFNKILSEKRANDVKKYLVKNGIEKKRIDVIGRGEQNLLNGCDNDKECDEAMHQQNRRVEFKVSRK